MAGIVLAGPAQLQRTRFVDKVARGTGLSPTVINAWIDAEGAYAKGGTGHFNYLNLRPSSNAGVPEGRSPGGFATFKSPDDAAAATVNVLHQQNMRPILNARGKSDKAQIDAIAQSPWDANHYRGKGGSVGALLLGAYNNLTKDAGARIATFGGQVAGGAGAAAGAAGDAAAKAADALNPLRYVHKEIVKAEHWMEGAAVRALAYIILTVVAIALFVLGLERTLGPTPLTRGLPPGTNPLTAKIPY